MRKLALLSLAIVTAAAVWFWRSANDEMASPTEAGQIALGRQLYAENCASCHGGNLEGQPDWKTPGPNGRLPAPPHDASGHTWHHSDQQLFTITKLGTAAVVGNGYESDMPGFGSSLTDDEIRAVLLYIKSTWPEREAAYQQGISRR
jgi:mono/diheme cytochrome c family protein